MSEHVDAWEKIIASSPPLVIVLLLGMVALTAVIRELYRRLNLKDEQLITLQEQTLETVKDNTVAVNALREAIQRGDRR